MSKRMIPIDRRTLLLGGAAAVASLTSPSAHTVLHAARDDERSGAPEDDSASSRTLDGKIALVTGSTDGLGRLVALRLAGMGAKVLVHGRDERRGAEVVAAINDRTPGRAAFYRADFSSLAEVRRLAAAVAADHERLHLLINNAGIGVGPRDKRHVRELSVDGYELRFAVNYLAGYLLTRLLIPNLVAGAPSRVINVASLAQREIDFDDLMLERGYDGATAYAQSKLAQVMFTQDLAAELAVKNVTVNAVHPATYMNTTMVRLAGAQPRSTVEQGAEAVIHLATDPALKFKSGLFFDGTRPVKADDQAYDAEARARLEQISERLVGGTRQVG